MGMNNIYYRFLHLVEDGEYQTMPARLRMNIIGNPGIDKLDFELLSLAVSAVNGCGLCVTSHEKQVARGRRQPRSDPERSTHRVGDSCGSGGARVPSGSLSSGYHGQLVEHGQAPAVSLP